MDNIITLEHGNGGRLMHELIRHICRRFPNNILREAADAAEFKTPGARLAFSTDSYVIKPLFFPGGDIGKLSVYGTVNDISMKGAEPLYISLAFIIEEGLSVSIFDKIINSIAQAARKAGVLIVTGDIKVVEKGSADKLFINTAGIGLISYPGRITAHAQINDLIIINGSIAEHGMAIFNAREDFKFISSIRSDCTNLNFDVHKCLKTSKNIHVMRDLTRGGLATSLNEIALTSNLGIEINESAIPVKPAVSHMCNILGFDPLYIANEGKFICIASAKDAIKLKQALGRSASIIGKMTGSHKKEVYLTTRIGSQRIIPMLESDQLPRIC
ncbi:MAG: hydrogenase expression/formation protein HypE [bacterium]